MSLCDINILGSLPFERVVHKADVQAVNSLLSFQLYAAFACFCKKVPCLLRLAAGFLCLGWGFLQLVSWLTSGGHHESRGTLTPTWRLSSLLVGYNAMPSTFQSTATHPRLSVCYNVSCKYNVKKSYSKLANNYIGLHVT